jgi:hypothetical protein
MGLFDWLKGPQVADTTAQKGYLASRKPPLNPTKAAIPRSTPLYADDTNTFRYALQLAISKVNPNRTQLIDIYDRCEIEAHLLFVINQRYNSILSKQWMLVNESGEEDKVAKDLFGGEWFRAFVRATAKASVRGTQLVQLASDIYPLTDNSLPTYVEEIDQRYFVPEFGIVRDITAGIDGQLYGEKPFADWLIQIGDDKDLGLMVAASVITILKKRGLSGWSERTDIISGLLRVGKTDLSDPEQKGYMEEALRTAGNLLYMVVGKEDEVEIVDPSQGSGNGPHEGLMEYYDKAVTRLFLGQTLTSDTGANGNKALGEVHQQTFDMIVQAECTRVQDIVNRELLPRLIKAGATWLTGLKFKYDTVERLSLTQLMEFVPKLLPYGKVEPQWMLDTLGVPFEYAESEVSALAGK